MVLLHLPSFLLSILVISSVAQAQYTVTSTYTDPGHSYYTAELQYSGQQPYYVNQTNTVIQTLNFTYFFAASGHLIIRLTDNNTERWEVPYRPPFPHVDVTKKLAPYDNANLQVDVTENPFSFKVTRKATSEVIFDSSVGDLIYSDVYLQLSTSLTTSNIYGLGERSSQFNLGPDGIYTILNKDNPCNIDDNKTPGHNLYGYHPVYLLREQSKGFNMVLLRSSAPMDVVLEGGKKLTYKVVGGIIDLNFFAGNDESDLKPETIVKQYHTYLGGWTLQPLWSLGNHQCKDGYNDLSFFKDVLDGYQNNGLALDAIWSSLEYMNAYIDFTLNENGYPHEQFRQLLAQYKKRWVPIIDAGIGTNSEIWKIGATNDIYLKDPNGTDTLGTVWPGETTFPDFFNPNASMFWDIGLKKLYELVPYAGIWDDMNEITSFTQGEVGWQPNSTDLFNNPPYIPNRPGLPIYASTLRMDAQHYDGTPELYAHNMFGLLETKATFDTLKAFNDLVFILSRATFYGSGQFAAHWTGDNWSSFSFLSVSVSHLMDFGLFGIPMTGAEICGFLGNTTEELCARWYQTGSLYPFSRNMHVNDSVRQEPYLLGPTVLKTAQVSFALRYSIIRHYYTQFLRQAGTGTIFRPLFFEYPLDENLFNPSLPYTDSQFFIGDALMSAPALNQAQDNVNAYFPQDSWFDFITGNLVMSAQETTRNLTIPTPLNATAPIFIRGGYIVPSQNTTNVLSTEDLNDQYLLNIASKRSDAADVFLASGQLVGVSNFDGDNVYIKCKLENCLYSLGAKITVSASAYQVLVSFSAEGKAENYETVRLSGLRLMGEWSTETAVVVHEVHGLTSNMDCEVVVKQMAENVIEYTFNPPYIVSDGATIDISIPTISV